MAVRRATWALGSKQGCSSSTPLRYGILFHVLLSPPKPLEEKKNKPEKVTRTDNAVSWTRLRFLCAPKASDQSLWMQINVCLLLRCYLLLILVPKAAPGATIAQSAPRAVGVSQVEDHPLLPGMAAAPSWWQTAAILPLLLLSFQRDICVLFVLWQLTQILMAYSS